jgi:hypothetical protein
MCIPADMHTYLQHFAARSDITTDESVLLEKQITTLAHRNPEAVISVNGSTHVDRAAYLAKNDLVVHLSQALIAFPIGESKGTHYTIMKAREAGIPVTVHQYERSEANQP